MTRPGHDADLEVIPVEGESRTSPPTPQAVPRPRRSGAAHRRRPGAAHRWWPGAAHRWRPGARRSATARPVVVALVVVMASILVAALVVSRRHRRPTPAHPAAAAINSRPSVSESQIVSVLGDKIIARDITDGGGGVGLLGVIRLAAVATIVQDGNHLLAQGTDITDLSGNGRTGAWAFPTDGSRGQVYLGPATGSFPVIDGHTAWLTNGPTAWTVNVDDGTTVGAVYPLTGRLATTVARCPVLQRGDQVVCWTPDMTPDSLPIGRGTVLGGFAEYVLWRAANGRLAITDPYTMGTWPTAVTVPPERPVGAASMSPGRLRVAVVDGNTLHIGDGLVGTHALTVSLGPIRDMAWVDDDTLIAAVGPRGLVAVDGATGTVVREPDFAFDARGLAVLTAT